MNEKKRWRLAVIGYGKIAHDQHLPAIAESPYFDLVAIVDPISHHPTISSFPSFDQVLQSDLSLDAVILCTPPSIRFDIALQALFARLAVFLEKPPAVTLSEALILKSFAEDYDIPLFASWHSRQSGAMNPAYEWLQDKAIQYFEVQWRENIREWHPNQDWLLKASGFGVFDPAMNALSILTKLIPQKITVEEMNLAIPLNREAAISAQGILSVGAMRGRVEFDFLHTGFPCWDIMMRTDQGELKIKEGGKILEINGNIQNFANEEYPRLYSNFNGLLESRRSDIDLSPLQLVTEMVEKATRSVAPDFYW
jgi:predicted dehydrogenase